jgi:type II secretory pathway pseudopilin PulG
MTLVETMVAIMIFGLSIGGMVSLVLVTRQLTDQARRHYVAINIAKNRVERARTFDWLQLDTFQETDTPVDVNGKTTDPSSADYHRTTTVNQVGERLLEFTVRVEIRDKVTLGFDGEYEEMKTYIAHYMDPWE